MSKSVAVCLSPLVVVPLVAFPFAVSTLAVSLHSQAPAPAASAASAAWKDPSPHRTQFVQVTAAVRLEVLDWGGTGRPLVLLAGGGDTAHVFDDFAPKLTDSFHVYGITRRGFGASGFAESEAGPDRMGDDVVAVLDALALKGPVLAGHSFGGAEMSSVASKHPARAAGLIYLDAGYPYAFDNGNVPAMTEFEALRPPQRTPPSGADLAGFDALRQHYQKVLGFTYPEAELRHRRSANPDGSVGKQRMAPGGATLLAHMKKYATISTPALFIFAHPQSLGRWVDDSSTDPAVREQVKAYTAALTALVDRQTKAIESGVPAARMVRLPGANHYVYLSHEADVLREMRAFLNGVR
jgi:pimeloyl-ACP methyl ester carboxylesterase